MILQKAKKQQFKAKNSGIRFNLTKESSKNI
jgi:hypothetical protein